MAGGEGIINDLSQMSLSVIPVGLEEDRVQAIWTRSFERLKREECLLDLW